MRDDIRGPTLHNPRRYIYGCDAGDCAKQEIAQCRQLGTICTVYSRTQPLDPQRGNMGSTYVNFRDFPGPRPGKPAASPGGYPQRRAVSVDRREESLGNMGDIAKLRAERLCAAWRWAVEERLPPLRCARSHFGVRSRSATGDGALRRR